jgi:hypothetical protein
MWLGLMVGWYDDQLIVHVALYCLLYMTFVDLLLRNVDHRLAIVAFYETTHALPLLYTIEEDSLTYNGLI